MARNTGRSGHIEGMKEARESLQQLNRHVQGLVGKVAVNAAADVFVDAITARAPVSDRPGNPTPGSLKRSIRKRSLRRTKNIARVEVIVDDVAAVPKEFGLATRDYPAEPFARPAVDDNRERAARALAGALKDEIEHGPWVKG